KLATQEVAAPGASQPRDELGVGRDRPEGCVVRLERGSEVAIDWRVTRPQNDVEVSGRSLRERPVCPAVRWRPAMQIDMRGDGGAQRQGLRIARRWQTPRPIHVEVARGEHVREILEAIGVRSTGVD